MFYRLRFEDDEGEGSHVDYAEAVVTEECDKMLCEAMMMMMTDMLTSGQGAVGTSQDGVDAVVSQALLEIMLMRAGEMMLDHADAKTSRGTTVTEIAV